MNITITPATEDDARDLGARMRLRDREEVWASGLLPPLEAALLSLELSTRAWTGSVDGTLVTMWGVCPGPGRIGIPWMLATDDLERHQRAFLRRNRAYIALMLERYDTLVNWVDARNTTSINWLRWLGFRLDPAAPFGALGLPFHRFEGGKPKGGKPCAG